MTYKPTPARILTAALLLVVGATAVLINACSKSSKAPTAPPPPSEPTCSLSVPGLGFGTVAVGSNADAQFSITNSGAGTLTGTVAVACPEFSLIGAGGYALSGGQSATFTVRFAPTSAGAKSCTVSTGSTKCATVTASGTGQIVAPMCDVSPTALNFGSVNYGASQNRIVNIRNTGGGTLAGSLRLPTSDYTVIGDPTFSLGAGEVKSFFIDFHPTTFGAIPCTLRVDPPGCTPVVCEGFGLLPVYGDCGVRVTSGDTLDFGAVSLGQSLDRLVTIRNTSSSFSSLGSAFSYCSDFVSGFSLDLPPGGSGPRAVRFTPTRLGVQYCAVGLSCRMNGAGTNPGVQDYFICRGVGVGGTPLCQVSTQVLIFGQVPVGQTKDLTFTVTNTGSGTLSGTAGPSPCPPEFSFVGAVAYSLAPGERATLTVRYTPQTVGHTTSCPLVPAGPGCATLTLVGEAVAGVAR